MTEQARTELKELQTLDDRIAEAEEKVRGFDPLFAEVEEPALVLEGEVNTTRTRLQEMKAEEHRLEVSVDEKRTRVKRLEERMGSVRNLREEAAVTAEHDMVKRALQNDEQEAFTLVDQMRKIEERLGELTAALTEAEAQVEPRRQELLTERQSAKTELDELRSRREAFAEGLDPKELRLYDGIRSGGKRRAVAELTYDGACGNCFGMVPLQLQNEIRHGTSLIRCEACGVILAAPAPKESSGDEAAAQG
jgi:predicted  nucleic acid-binding Zn-ribbon protein